MELIQKQLPNAVATFVLGICSLIFSMPPIGLALGIIGLAISGRGKRDYEDNPDLYTGYGMLKAGRIMSILGIIFSAVSLLCFVLILSLVEGVGKDVVDLLQV